MVSKSTYNYINKHSQKLFACASTEVTRLKLTLFGDKSNKQLPSESMIHFN